MLKEAIHYIGNTYIQTNEIQSLLQRVTGVYYSVDEISAAAIELGYTVVGWFDAKRRWYCNTAYTRALQIEDYLTTPEPDYWRDLQCVPHASHAQVWLAFNLADRVTIADCKRAGIDWRDHGFIVRKGVIVIDKDNKTREISKTYEL